MSKVVLPAPSEPVIDKETGLMRESWYRYFGQQQINSVNSDVFTSYGVLDEDDLASDSATDVPTQQSVKAYVDTNLSTLSTAGEWTPTILVGTTQVDTYALQAGRYVRSAGGMVQVWGSVVVSSLTGTTGIVTIGGLPVRSSSTLSGIKYSGVVGYSTGVNTASSVGQGIPYQCAISTGSTVIDLYNMTTHSANPLNSARLTTAASLSFAINYETTL